MTVTDITRDPIAYGWQVYRHAIESEWRGKTIGVLAADLHDALDLHSALLNDLIHPAAEWGDLASDPEAKHVALQRAAEDVAEWAAELARVLQGCEAAAEEGDQAA